MKDNVTYVDFKALKEQKQTMNKIAAENFNASTRTSSWISGYTNWLTSGEREVKPYALNPVKETEE